MDSTMVEIKRLIEEYVIKIGDWFALGGPIRADIAHKAKSALDDALAALEKRLAEAEQTIASSDARIESLLQALADPN